MSDKAGRVVFIGNIPYGLTEEQIVEQFSTVGHVLNFRLVYDNETGKPKGFGFAEYADTDSAASAVRNFNNFEIQGRTLRVDYSHVGGKSEETTSDQHNTQQPPPQMQPQNGYPPPLPGNLPPLPPGVELPPNMTCPDAISQTLSTLQPAQLLDILSQMKGLVMGDPAKATELLKQAPQLSYAIFQALLLLGLVDTSVLTSVVEQSQKPSQAPPQQPIPPRPTPAYQTPQTYPPYGQMPTQMQVSTPPLPQQFQPSPVQNPTPQPPPQQQTEQEKLVQQVLAMSQQQIDSLPPGDRLQIMALRQQLRGW
ncbi:hypothetical protein MMC21_001212 [Puttea exsequens]|nr:hypothetical protein [Puttea exsequens]